MTATVVPPETGIDSVRLMTAQDLDGCRRNIGVAITRRGQVALVEAERVVGIFTPREAVALLAMLREAIGDAAAELLVGGR